MSSKVSFLPFLSYIQFCLKRVNGEGTHNDISREMKAKRTCRQLNIHEIRILFLQHEGKK